MTNTLPTITVTSPRINHPYPVTPNINPVRPNLPNIDFNRGQFTNLIELYQGVQTLDGQLDPLEKEIDFILSHLSPEEKSSLSGAIEGLRQQATDAKANADRKFSESISRLNLWNIYNAPKYQTNETRRLDFLGAALSTFEPRRLREWESEYGVARRHEIHIKQTLVDAYQRLLPTLNTAYLSKFYPDYTRFPTRSQEGANRAINEIGARNLHNGFLDNKVEILISDSMLTQMGSQFGHVAINIGGVIYGRAPAAWDIRTKEDYLSDQQSLRSTIGYVIQLDEAGKQKLFQSVVNKIVKDEKYSLIDNSCSSEIISAFAELGINIVDPRYTIGEIYSPADMDNFLKRFGQVIQTNLYPKQ